MKGALGLSADFLDRLANPLHGAAVNEEYGMRLAELVDRDPRLVVDLLVGSELGPDDSDLLSTSGWRWYLATLRGTEHRPPDALLHALWDAVPVTLLRLRILELVTNDPTTTGSEAAQGLDPWLVERIDLAMGADGETREDPEPIRELVVLLLQVGNVVALEAARVAIDRDARRDGMVRASVSELLSGLDDETRAHWFDLLGL